MKDENSWIEGAGEVIHGAGGGIDEGGSMANGFTGG